MKIRQGRKNKRNLYLQWGEEPSDNDVCVGFAVNAAAARDLCQLATAGMGLHDERLVEHLERYARD